MFFSDPIFVVCVDDDDVPLDVSEKLSAHQTGVLHRAVSIYLKSSSAQENNQKILLQRRCSKKYHSPGLWSNAACTHPLENETPEMAARRALQTELGISVKNLDYQGYFIYKTDVGEKLIEHELDHVFVGELSETAEIPFSQDEVDHVRWVSSDDLALELVQSPDSFTHWFPYLRRYLGDPVSGSDFRG